jgi:hypothetical protein
LKIAEVKGKKRTKGVENITKQTENSETEKKAELSEVFFVC